MSSEKLQHLVVKPACVGLAAWGITKFLYPDYTFNWSNTVYDWSTIAAVTTAGSSLISEVAHEYVFPGVPAIGRLMNEPMTEGVSIAAMTGANAVALNMLNPDALGELGFAQLGILSAGAEILGSYAYDHLVMPTLRSIY